MKKFAIRVLKVLFILVASAGLLEGLCTIWAWWKFGTVSVRDLNSMDAGMVAAVTPAGKTFAETVRPHPYLGIVPNSESFIPSAWKMDDISKFPVERDPAKFTILLTGGSSAMHLGAAHKDETSHTFLESAIERIDFGGREPLILNAAEGGTTQPRQAIALLMYGDVVDAVVTLDGFNECAFLGRNAYARKLGAPPEWFEDLNPLVNGYDRLGASWQANELRDLSNNCNSRAVFLATRAFRRRLESTSGEPDDFYMALWRKPRDWSQEQQVEWNTKRYEHYIRMMHSMAGELKIQEAHFVQPCPAIDKELTGQEKRDVGSLEYAGAYQKMNDALVGLNGEQIPVISLINCFQSVGETVYVDNVHNNAAGYRILADRIADELASLWKLKLKPAAE